MNGDEWLVFADKMVNLGTILHNIFIFSYNGLFLQQICPYVSV